MIPFRGNAEQIRILEQMFRHLGGKKMWKVDADDNIPLFTEQKDFDTLVYHRKYLIRTDVGKFIPEIYTIKFVYNENKGSQSEVHMPREVVDWLLKQGAEEQIKGLEIRVGDKPKEDIPLVIPDIVT
jgi:hypothetical protein